MRMAEDLDDIEAMLEAPYKKDKEDSSKLDKSSKENDRDRDRKRDRSHDRDRDKKNSTRRERSRSRDRADRDRRSRDRRRSRSRERRRSRSRSRERHREQRSRERSPREKSPRAAARGGGFRRSRSRSREYRKRRSISPTHLAPHLVNNDVALRKYGNRKSPPFARPVVDDLSPEERDQRTVFCMQLSQRVRGRDLEEFFSSVGKVRDVKLITCNKTRRFKGIAYVEFYDIESVALAMGLTGQKIHGVPIVVQPTQAEKNRVGGSIYPPMMPIDTRGPTRLYVGSLHFNITEDMLRGIFEPFGKIESIQLMVDPETGRSKGYGFITYKNAEDAKKALEQLNGFELAGRPMKVGNVQERNEAMYGGTSFLDNDELDRSGIDLGATGRLQLMYKLAEGTGLQIPAAAANALNLAQPAVQQPTPPIATQCFMLSNMFDPSSESGDNWDVEIRDDVIEECNKHGGVLHVYVDKTSSSGNVYVKCPSIATAVASVNSLHGRWFAGRIITAAYVPLMNYHSLFSEALTATQLLLPSVPRTK